MATLVEDHCLTEVHIQRHVFGQDIATVDARVIVTSTTYLADGTPLRSVYRDITDQLNATQKQTAENIMTAIETYAKNQFGL